MSTRRRSAAPPSASPRASAEPAPSSVPRSLVPWSPPASATRGASTSSAPSRFSRCWPCCSSPAIWRIAPARPSPSPRPRSWCQTQKALTNLRGAHSMTSIIDRPALTPDRTEPWRQKVYSSGWTDGRGEQIPVTDKATGVALGSVGSATSEDLDDAVAAARTAQRAWAAAPYLERAAVLLRAAAILEAEPDRLLPWLIREAGSAQGKAAFELSLVVSELRESAAATSAPYGELLRSTKPRLSMARYVPIGVVGVISPFNFPGILSMRSVAPALALGNAVILKPDPRTAVAGGLALAGVLHDAGLPAGLLHVFPGGADLGRALVAHPGIPCLSFTGSTNAGRAIAATAAPLFKKIHLELGGNNALLVLPDLGAGDLEAAASAGAWGSFLHQGQICMTTGRHLVPRSRHDHDVDILAAKADALTAGDPTDPGNALGALIDGNQRDKVHAMV